MKGWSFADTLLKWHELNPREMPWLETKDPYKIWISEIILQQTRVGQGWQYYEKFISRFPDLKTLHESEESEILKYWEGLGYYTRARNIKKAVTLIFSDFNGFFPVQYQDILSLPGIGPYTASAIAGFAYDQPYPVLDGNVARLISRYLAILTPPLEPEGKTQIFQFLHKEIRKIRPSKFNQAIMNFGALVCKPSKPDCHVCPFSENCNAYHRQVTHLLPVSTPKKEKVSRYFHYFILIDPESFRTVIQKRTENDIWKHLYEFPLIESSTEGSISEKVLQDFKNRFGIQKNSKPFQKLSTSQNLTHRKIHFSLYIYFWDGKILSDQNRYIVDGIEKLLSYGFPVTLSKTVLGLKEVARSMKPYKNKV